MRLIIFQSQLYHLRLQIKSKHKNPKFLGDLGGDILQNKYSKKQLEELYNCDIFKDFGFDDSHLFLVAQGLPFTEDGDDCLFVHADGWDLDELHENIREAIREHCIVFDGE